MSYSSLLKEVKKHVKMYCFCFLSKGCKVTSFKVADLKKKATAWPQPWSNQSARIRVHPGLNHSKSLMASNFVAL